MGQNSSKGSTSHSMAYFTGHENGGHAKLAINGTRRSVSLGQLPKSDKKGPRSSERKKRGSKDVKLESETKSLLQKQFEKQGGGNDKHSCNNNKPASNRVVQNGDILYRNVMKDSASETDDYDNAVFRKNGKKHFGTQNNHTGISETSFIRNTEHVPDADFDHFVKKVNTSNERHSLVENVERLNRRSYSENVEHTNRKYEDFIARLRHETQNSHRGQEIYDRQNGYNGHGHGIYDRIDQYNGVDTHQYVKDEHEVCNTYCNLCFLSFNSNSWLS